MEMSEGGPSFFFYVILVLTILNVGALIFWLVLTGVIRTTSGVNITGGVSTGGDVSYTSLSGTGNVNNGIISFTVTSAAQNGRLPITVAFPYNPPTNFAVAVIGISGGGSSTSDLGYTVTSTTANSFTFVNDFPFTAGATYVVSYVVVFP
jgi:hypothetical protein